MRERPFYLHRKLLFAHHPSVGGKEAFDPVPSARGLQLRHPFSAVINPGETVALSLELGISVPRGFAGIVHLTRLAALDSQLTLLHYEIGE